MLASMRAGGASPISPRLPVFPTCRPAPPSIALGVERLVAGAELKEWNCPAPEFDFADQFDPGNRKI